MPRPAPGRYQHQIEADAFEAPVPLPRQERFGRADDTPALGGTQAVGVRRPRAAFHLDERDDGAAAGDDIDLASRRAQIASEDAVALEAQQGARCQLRQTAEALRRPAAVGVLRAPDQSSPSSGAAEPR